MYGNEVTVIDATYNTSRYDIPLFFLSVLTNCGYTVTASFLLSRETTANISEALLVISKWNPSWLPKYFVCDYDQREITAIENTFKGICYTCIGTYVV